MASAHLLRLQIEAALFDRIPSALTPAPRVIHPTAPTGIAALDERLGGGLPVGAISELTAPECSGRTSLALSFVAGLTEAGRVCAWVDVSDALDPESAAACGVDLERLLWVRCGGAQMGGMEPTSGAKAPDILCELSARLKSCPDTKQNSAEKKSEQKMQVLRLRSPAATSAQDDKSFLEPRCAEPQPRVIRKNMEAVPAAPEFLQASGRRMRAAKPWSRLDQALRATDLLLQAGGFSAIVLDMGSVTPEFALRVPLATWYRYRAAAERTQACVVLLTQRACAKSSAGVVLTLAPSGALTEGETVLTGAAFEVEIARERFAKAAAFGRKPPQSDYAVRWQSHSNWAGRK